MQHLWEAVLEGVPFWQSLAQIFRNYTWKFIFSMIRFWFYQIWIYRQNESIVKVFIADSECSLTSLTTTQIICITGTYSRSSTKAPIQVFIDNIGLSLNVTNNFNANVLRKLIILNSMKLQAKQRYFWIYWLVVI